MFDVELRRTAPRRRAQRLRPARERSRELRHQFVCRAGFFGLLSHRKNTMIITAGTNGPHQTSRPKALRVEDPPLTKAMIAPAHANALIRLSAVNFNGRTPAYAHAIG